MEVLRDRLGPWAGQSRVFACALHVDLTWDRRLRAQAAQWRPSANRPSRTGSPLRPPKSPVPCPQVSRITGVSHFDRTSSAQGNSVTKSTVIQAGTYVAYDPGTCLWHLNEQVCK